MNTSATSFLATTIPAGEASSRKDSPEKIQEAATQFEALLVAQMLRQVREAGSGGLTGDSSDKSGDHLMGFAEEQLAQVLSANGGLGIARMGRYR